MPSVSKALFTATVLLAGSTAALAQRTEIMFAGGTNLNSSNGRNTVGGSHSNYQFLLKAGKLFPSRLGIGLVYEVAKFTSDVRYTYINSNNTQTTVELNEEVANPQHLFGVELYGKFFVAERSYIRLGGVLGYALGNSQGVTSTGLNLGGGLDAAFLFPLARRLSGVVSTGFRYYSVRYGDKIYVKSTQTLSFPLTIGLNYKFAGRSQPRARTYDESEE